MEPFMTRQHPGSSDSVPCAPMSPSVCLAHPPDMHIILIRTSSWAAQDWEQCLSQGQAVTSVFSPGERMHVWEVRQSGPGPGAYWTPPSFCLPQAWTVCPRTWSRFWRCKAGTGRESWEGRESRGRLRPAHRVRACHRSPLTPLFPPVSPWSSWPSAWGWRWWAPCWVPSSPSQACDWPRPTMMHWPCLKTGPCCSYVGDRLGEGWGVRVSPEGSESKTTHKNRVIRLNCFSPLVF